MESSMNRLYLTDLDKTFLRSDLGVSDYSTQVWNRLVEEGGKLSIATARSYTGVRKLLEGLRLEEPLILLDGVMIASGDGEPLHIASLPRDTADAVIELGRKEAYQQELLETYHNDRRLLDADPLRAMERNLKIVYMESEEVTAGLESAFRELFGDEIEIKRSKDPYIDCWFMTVLHAEGDKAHALLRLEELEGVERSRTTVFGDSHNDIGLFGAAGCKIAVANAIDESSSGNTPKAGRK